MLLIYHKESTVKVFAQTTDGVAKIKELKKKKKKSRGGWERTKTNTWGCTWLCLCDEYYSLGKPKIVKWPKFPQVPEAVIHLMSTTAREQIPSLL